MSNKKPREFWIEGIEDLPEFAFRKAHVELARFDFQRDKPIHVREVLEPSPSQDAEFDEEYVGKVAMNYSSDKSTECGFIDGARWQFNQMKRKSTESR